MYYLRNKDRIQGVHKKYKLENREKILVRNREYDARTRDRRLEYSRQYRATHRAERIQKQREYDAKNHDKKLARGRKNLAERREFHNTRLREYKRANKSKMATSNRRWYLENIEEIRAKAKLQRIRDRDKRLANVEKRRALKLSVTVDAESAEKFYLFVRSRKLIPCYYCGKKVNGREAHVDHVIALSSNGNHCSSNLAASCPECNLRKHTKKPSELKFTPQPLLDL